MTANLDIMLYDYENIWENIVYIQAREGSCGSEKHKRRSKKWRKLLKFPPLIECQQFAEEDQLKTYDYVVSKQPIGAKLFNQFCCTSSKQYHRHVNFLNDVESYELELEENREKSALNIVQNYLGGLNGVNNVIKKSDSVPNSDRTFPNSNSLSPLLDAEEGESSNVSSDPKSIKDYISVATAQSVLNDVRTKRHDLFKDCVIEIEEFLALEPFQEFKKSIYFQHYLQWLGLERQPVTMKTFYMYRVLGKGGFGEVCACQTRSSGKMYACKKFDKKYIKKYKAESMVLNEKVILEKVNSRFVVNLTYAFETKEALCLVLTIMSGGDLKFHIYKMGDEPGFNESRARFYAAEILLGLHHLHSNGIVHRDCKPENILLDDHGHLRISDLGLAVQMTDGKVACGRVGTTGYMAPEVIKNEKYTYSPDFFALGCMIYEMIDGTRPFYSRREKITRTEIDRRVLENSESYSDRFSEDAKDLCKCLLKKTVHKRIGCTTGRYGANEIMLHPWFASHINWRRMKAGKEDPPFVPDPHAVYAKDVLDIEQFSSVKGVTLETSDETFYAKFNTGAVSIAWQKEMIESGIFDELNAFKGDRNPQQLEYEVNIESQKSCFHNKCVIAIMVICPCLWVAMLLMIAVILTVRK